MYNFYLLKLGWRPVWEKAMLLKDNDTLVYIDKQLKVYVERAMQIALIEDDSNDVDKNDYSDDEENNYNNCETETDSEKSDESGDETDNIGRKYTYSELCGLLYYIQNKTSSWTSVIKQYFNKCGDMLSDIVDDPVLSVTAAGLVFSTFMCRFYFRN